jgi:glycosyltransferase involved in cell wall biosynthesis
MKEQFTTPISTNADRFDASVIVCTYNRAESLTRTLGALAAQQLEPITRWELLIVDNNSSDGTRAAVEGFAATCSAPVVRYFFEPTQGLSHARNRGIREARGEVLLFTDDDVRPEPDWIRNILNGMEEHRCDACGGYIAPEWEAPPPSWLSRRFYGFLALRTDRVDTFAITSAADAPFGANMAMRRATFDRAGLFDTSRGRKGTLLSSGEDGELFERILAAGGRVMFFGHARVHHRVEADRLNKPYFRRWRYQNSRNKGEALGVPGTKTVLGVPLYLVPQTVRALRRALWARVTLPEDEAFFREMIVWHYLGLIRGLYSRRQRSAIG